MYGVITLWGYVCGLGRKGVIYVGQYFPPGIAALCKGYGFM